MPSKIRYLVIFIFFFPFLLFSKDIKYALIKVSRLNFREGPSIKSKIIAKLTKNTKVIIISKKDRWYKILIPSMDNLTGWVYYSGLYKFTKVHIPDYKVEIKFNNFNNTFKNKIIEFKKYLNFEFYKKDVEVIFSYEKTMNKLSIFIKTDFSLDYYNQNKDKSLKNNELDLYPFLNFSYVIGNLIKKIEYKYPACGEFLKKFSIEIILSKSDNSFIILSLYRKNKLYKFYPFIIVNYPGYKMVKIYTENPEKLEKSYIFELEPPYYSYGIKSTSFLLYDFFKMM